MKPDPKPRPRIKDPSVYGEFHSREHFCVSCPTARGIQAHHVVQKGAPYHGDDVLDNLLGLCLPCHGALHGNPYRAWGVRIDSEHVGNSIGRFLMSEAGDEQRHYILRKLGWDAGWAYMERHFGIDREVAA